MTAPLETVTRIYEGWAHGDFTASLGDLDDHVILVISPEIPDGGAFTGLEGVRKYMERFLEAWDRLTIAAESMEEFGDTILVRVHQTGIGRGSGATSTLDYFMLWTFRGDRAIRIESIVSEERARAAVGPGG